jgi:coiled-coil domain-containing protein 12
MSLQEVSDVRKARLIALRNRKEGRSTGTNGYVIMKLQGSIILIRHRDSVLLSRNYDPETRTLKKHSRNEDLATDTVEKAVEGVAEKIIAEEELQRNRELVCQSQVQ